MTRYKIALSALALAFPLAVFSLSAVAAEEEEELTEEFVYEGTIGSAPVVLDFATTEDSSGATFFYRGQWFDNEVHGGASQTVFKLQSDVTGAKLTLKHLDMEGLVMGGTMTANGKKLAVRLRRVKPEAAGPAPAGAPDGLSLYERMRLAGLTLRSDTVETIAGKKLHWYVEPVSGFRLFRLEDGYAAPALAAMNASLTKLQWTYLSRYFSSPGPKGGAGLRLSVVGPYLSDTHMSFAVKQARDSADGSEPLKTIKGATFDARTGKQLTLVDYLPFGNQPVPRLFALLKRLHPNEMSPESEGCDYSNSAAWEEPSWHLTEKGLYVIPDFSDIACDTPDWPVIPYAALK